MSEEYKFVGFGSDFELHAKVEHYVTRLIEEFLASVPDRNCWSFIRYMGDSDLDDQQLLLRRFQLSPDTVIVGCRNSDNLKGLRVQIHDPSVSQDEELGQGLSVSYIERPSHISAFMDEFGIEGEERFSRDLVIICELTKRTEAIARELIRRYVSDGLSYEAMAPYAQEVSDQEAELWKRWTGKLRLR